MWLQKCTQFIYYIAAPLISNKPCSLQSYTTVNVAEVAFALHYTSRVLSSCTLKFFLVNTCSLKELTTFLTHFIHLYRWEELFCQSVSSILQAFNEDLLSVGGHLPFTYSPFSISLDILQSFILISFLVHRNLCLFTIN